MDAKITPEQIRADLDMLSAQDFETKYPGLSTKEVAGLSVEELEQRISKQSSGTNLYRPGAM